MMLKLVREMKGYEFVEKMKEQYKTIDKLERLAKKYPENYLYKLDLEDWIYFLKHPNGPIKQTESLFIDKFRIKTSDLELLDTVKRKHPRSIRNLSQLLGKDIKTVYPKVKRLEEGGFLKLEEGPKNSKIPIVNYDKIEIEI